MTPDGTWQLREFHLVADATGKAFLRLSPTAGTPDDSKDNQSDLRSFISANNFAFMGGFATLPSSLIGGQSTENHQWFTGVTTASVRAFAGQTCNGCHNGEMFKPDGTALNIDGFYQISSETPENDAAPDRGLLSPFIVNFEIPRRTRFMQNRLTCKADLSDCSSGAEPML